MVTAPQRHIDCWAEGTDVERAEREVAWLQEMIASADDAIEAQRRIIGHDGPLFAHKLSLQGLIEDQKSLESQLQAVMANRQREVLDFALDGPRYDNNRAPARALGDFLKALQGLYVRVGQALSTPRPGKTIAPEINSLCQLEVADFFPSSFGVRFTAPTRTDLAGRSLTTDALEATFELVNAQEPLKEVARVGKWSLSKYRVLVKTLLEAEATPKVRWITPAGQTRTWVADDNQLLVLSNRLANIRDSAPQRKQATGTLTGASLRRQRFEFSADSEVITGVAPRELADQVTNGFGKHCQITYMETVFIDEMTEQEKKSRTLLNVQVL